MRCVSVPLSLSLSPFLCVCMHYLSLLALQPADVEFEEEGLTTATNGKWVTVMADMPGISCGRFEWEIEVRFCLQSFTLSSPLCSS